MARSYSSSSSSSKNSLPKKHEVFISFRSEDTRRTFTSHLDSAFKRLEITTYIDNNLESGDEIPATLVSAIEEAKLSVIVFSENYAASEWCLDELVKILECGKTRRQIVVPVFYDIDPSHVRNQRESYAEAFAKHERKFQGKMEKVQEWRKALLEAANLSGWDCNVSRVESELVENIAKDVLEKLDRVYVGDLDHQITKFEQLAQLQGDFYESIPTLENLNIHRATIQRITELKMERSVRLLRLTPDMLPYVHGNFKSDY
ncbi:TMV resistance protein N-like [Lotus japonicus]|uniref:TMV resistance protein N-like n=1 Tax=Lotus japonicus TaxID=34305 RepID=UPI00258CAD57|nr:TMV resistance protein N-like [Lotus japonicus]